MNATMNASQINYLSNKTRCVIRKTPVPGEGLDRWLYPVAMCLIGDRVSEDPGVELLYRLALEKGRDERTARKEAERLRRLWTGNGPVKSNRPPAPKVNVEKIRELVSGNRATIADLVDQSPIKLDPGDETAADNIVDLLFPDGDIICVGFQKWEAFCYPHREMFRDEEETIPLLLSEVAYIVPNPMRERGQWVNSREWKPGKPSPKGDGNIRRRNWLCVEWDMSKFARDGVTPSFWKPILEEWESVGIQPKDAQTRLLAHLSTFEFKLGMVVDSGGKSLHSWFAVAHATESQIEHFMRYAISIGADAAGRIPSQFCRMPHGTRDNGKRQPVLFIDPKILTNNKRKQE